MTTGFQHANDVLCASFPGSGSGLAGGDEKPNVFYGMRMDGIGCGDFTVGTADFAIECWLCNRDVGGDASGQTIVGFADLVAEAVLNRTGLSQNPTAPRARYYDLTAEVSTGAGSVKVDWHHYVLNYDRSGNVDLIIDGTTESSVAINAVNVTAREFYPLTGSSDDDPLKFHSHIGPIALHIGTLLTSAQINDSILDRYVNNLTQTVFLYDWTGIRGQTGWTAGTQIVTSAGEGDDDEVAVEIPASITFRATGPVFAPLGTNGTVVVPDLSGSGNDFAVPTAASYSAVSYGNSDSGNPQATQANAVFGTDPFFLTGGGLRWL